MHNRRFPIVINARAAARVQVGGVERWAREMAVRLPELRPGGYTVARPPAALAHRAGHVWEQAVLPARAARRRAPLVYSPANLAPVAWPRNALLLHDVAGLRHPEWYSAAYVAWQRRVIPAVARRARALMTVSEFSRAEIAETLGLDPERIHVIPGGVGPEFTPDADPGPAAHALRIERPYVLTLATASPRKNRSALAEAARALGRHGIDLLVAGGARGYMRPDPTGLRELGYVEEEHLPGLYAGARAFVLASLHEGFGLPCLEAMATGVPVVAADRGALPETCAGAALLVDPGDPAAVAQATVNAACEEPRRAALREGGLRRAAQLTWDVAARRTDALLQDAAGS